MEDNVGSGKEAKISTANSLSRIEKLNRATWAIFISLIGFGFLVVGVSIGEGTLVLCGISIVWGCGYVGLRLYAGLPWLGPQVLGYLRLFKLISIVLFVFFIVFGVIGSVLHDAQSLNSEQKKLVGGVTPDSQRDFLRFSCKAKAICATYPEILQNCAAAGSIQKCISIRMHGEDSSMCLDNGQVGGLDEKTSPSFVQCTAFKIDEFLK